MALIDAGLNLTSSQYDNDRDLIMARAKEAGVESCLIIGGDEDDSRHALTLAKQYTVFATAGVHPHYAKTASPELSERLSELSQAPEVVAIGECGLDFNRDFSPRPQQRAVFATQLELANSLDMPVYMHERDAHDDMLAMLKEYQPKGIVHCFTGTPEQAKAYLDLGLYLGVTGWVCDERRGSDLNAALRVIPLERLIIETDGPYLLPRTIRPKPKSRRCESAHLPYVVEHLADAYQSTSLEIATHTSANFKRLFL